MMRATGSPLACRIAKVTSETPDHHHERSRTSRRTTNAVTGAAAARYFFGLASKSQSHSSPRAAYSTFLRDGQGVVLSEQEDARAPRRGSSAGSARRSACAAPGRRGAPLVDQLVEAFDARVVLADPAPGLGVVERVQHGVGVEDGVVAPGAVGRRAWPCPRSGRTCSRPDPGPTSGRSCAVRPRSASGAMASNCGRKSTDALCTVMSTPFGNPAWASSSLAFFGIVRDRAGPPRRSRTLAAVRPWPPADRGPPISFWMMACLSIA